MKVHATRIGSRWRRAGVAILALVLGVWLLFRTAAGPTLVVRLINSALRGRVQVEGPSGNWPFQGNVAWVALSDVRGPWLVLSNVSWQVDGRDVLRPPLVVRQARAESADWLRKPVASSNSSRCARVPALSLPHLEVSHVRPASNLVAGASLDLRVQAGLEHGDEGWLMVLEAGVVDAASTLNATLRTTPSLALAVQVHEPQGGLLSQRLRLGDAGVHLSLWAERATAGWQGSLQVQASDRQARLAWAHPADGSWAVDAVATNLKWVVAGKDVRVEAARVRWRPEERRGRFQVTARCDNEPVWAEGALVRRPTGISLPNLLITADGLRARLYVQRDASWSVDARYSFAAHSALSRWLPASCDAEGRGTFTWGGDGWHARTFLSRVDGPGIQLDAMEIVAQRAADGVIRFDAGVQELRRGEIAWLNDIHVKGQAQARSPGWRVQVDSASAQRGEIPLALRAPFELGSATQGVFWSRACWSVGSGEVTSAGRWGSELDAEVTWRDLSPALLLPKLSSEVSGLAQGQVVLRGTAEAPQLEAMLKVQDLRFQRSAASFDLAPAAVQAEMKVGDHRVVFRVEGSGWTEKPLLLEGELPVRWTARPWSLVFPRDEPGRGSLHGVFDLSRVERIVDLHGARVRGQLEGELNVAGTRDTPVVQGRVTVRHGSLDLPASGTSLRDIEVVLEGDERRLTVREATARDSGAGRLEASGHAVFDPERKFPLDLTLNLTQAELWRQGRSRAVINGELAVRGDLSRMDLTGQVMAPVVEIQLAAPRPSVQVLPVRGRPAEAQPVDKPAPTSRWADRVHLGVDLKARPGAVVRGRGLDSLWRVDLRANGTVAHPEISGGIQSRRGYFLFMGRRFDLESGLLTLDGRHPPQPNLDLVATSRASDLQARLQVSGSVREPVLALTSDPPYPTDEILSRLLFGKSADSISAFQAISLAHGLNTLRGKGSTLDVLNRGQALLKVDQIDLRQDQEQGTISSVAVGKYIGRNVFVQGATALDGSGDVISVDVDLAPSLTLQTETSPGIREGIGLRWRRDY